jgi:hypothetical protein
MPRKTRDKEADIEAQHHLHIYIRPPNLEVDQIELHFRIGIAYYD